MEHVEGKRVIPIRDGEKRRNESNKEDSINGHNGFNGNN
jgi:hypothetical protein